MGKGDKKTKRGKIIMGSHGVSRPNKKGHLLFTKRLPKLMKLQLLKRKLQKKLLHNLPKRNLQKR